VKIVFFFNIYLPKKDLTINLLTNFIHYTFVSEKLTRSSELSDTKTSVKILYKALSMWYWVYYIHTEILILVQRL